MKVLIVEDNAYHSDSYTDRLEELGVSREAIEVCENVEGAKGRLTRVRFDAVLLDLQLPQRDEGIKLLKWLRETPGPNQKVEVAVVTVRSDSEAVRRIIELGCGEHFAKPVDRERFAGWARRTLLTPGATADGR